MWQQKIWSITNRSSINAFWNAASEVDRLLQLLYQFAQLLIFHIRKGGNKKGPQFPEAL